MRAMRVSEKSLELNVGSEFLARLRACSGMTKTYLRGLTQREEKAEGVDFYAQMNPTAAIFAFQFKAPVAHRNHQGDCPPYRFTLIREQHRRLIDLARINPSAVFYVFPFYATPIKLQNDVPNLLRDTWLLPVSTMRDDDIFGVNRTKRIYCHPARAEVNPVYEMQNAMKMTLTKADGVKLGQFIPWYQMLRGHVGEREDQPESVKVAYREDDADLNMLKASDESTDGIVSHRGRKHTKFMSPQVVRGMRIAVVE